MKNKIAIIPVKGHITSEEFLPISLPFLRTVPSNKIIEYMEKARKEKVKGIIFDINSRGGNPFPSKEIAESIKELKNFGIYNVARIGEYGTSGAYWVASACNYIVADELSRVGSIGVLGMEIDISEFLQRQGIKYGILTSGKYIDKLHEYFTEEIRKNRDLSESVVEQLAHGRSYLGEEAKKLGLIDQLGRKREAIEVISKQARVSNFDIIDYDKEFEKMYVEFKEMKYR
ncbi:MAG: S49 family peptidase [Candidatus Aenigmarchaeota archaeon]|nr:S49 family peptidase [Candidatus Aenigmarchaeota archaeon]